MQSRTLPSRAVVGVGIRGKSVVPSPLRLPPHDCVYRRWRVLPRATVAADRGTLDITKMEPLGDRVLVKPFEREEKTEGGILLPSSAADAGRDACFGEVLSVGDDVEVEVTKGDKVVFTYASSAKVEVTDGEIVFVHDKSILATLS